MWIQCKNCKKNLEWKQKTNRKFNHDWLFLSLVRCIFSHHLSTIVRLSTRKVAKLWKSDVNNRRSRPGVAHSRSVSFSIPKGVSTFDADFPPAITQIEEKYYAWIFLQNIFQKNHMIIWSKNLFLTDTTRIKKFKLVFKSGSANAIF